MKLTERRDGLYLEDLTEGDVRFANVGGRLTGSTWEDPNNPKHSYVVNIHDKAIADDLAGRGFNVKERLNAQTGEFETWTLEFRAYPGIRQNFKTGNDEVQPKIMLRSTTGTKYVQLDIPAFGEADSIHIKEANIRFRLYHNKRFNRNIAVIDQLWVWLSQDAGTPDEDYYESKLGGGDEEVPF